MAACGFPYYSVGGLSGSPCFQPAIPLLRQANLTQVSTLGGETSAIVAPFPVTRIGDISPDRSALLTPAFTVEEDEAPLWVLPLPSGTPHRLGELLGHDGTWSPDGQRILFTSGRDLYIASADGAESRKLASLPGIPWWPRWSSDGSLIRLSVADPQAPGSDSLWEVHADGTHLHPLLSEWNNPPEECCGNWTPDGKYFIFQSTHNSKNSKTQIWALPEQGGLLRKARREPTELTAGPMSYFIPPPVAARDDNGDRLAVAPPKPCNNSMTDRSGHEVCMDKR
jgi:Tol biopolymer transport system component